MGPDRKNTEISDIEVHLRRRYPSYRVFAAYRLRVLNATWCEPEDLVQETVARIMKTDPLLLLEDQYVFASIANLACDFIKRETHPANPKVQNDAFFERQPSETRNPEEQVLEQEEACFTTRELNALKQAVVWCLRKLRASKTILKLLDPESETFFLLKKPRELGRLLGKSPRTISNNLTWIRKRVYPCIKEQMIPFYQQGERPDE